MRSKESRDDSPVEVQSEQGGVKPLRISPPVIYGDHCRQHLQRVLPAPCPSSCGKLEGTVRFYGCPADETLIGKVFMAKAGAFSDLDAAITWHPMWLNTAWGSSSLAMNSVRFVFHGRTAHATAAPHMGISALDAVELMNTGVKERTAPSTIYIYRTG